MKAMKAKLKGKEGCISKRRMSKCCAKHGLFLLSCDYLVLWATMIGNEYFVIIYLSLYVYTNNIILQPTLTLVTQFIKNTEVWSTFFRFFLCQVLGDKAFYVFHEPCHSTSKKLQELVEFQTMTETFRN